MSNNSPFDPYWLYEMGKMDAERQHKSQPKPTPSQTAGLRIGLVIMWAFLTPILAFVLWVFANLFLGWDFWICLIVSGLFSLWLCSLFVR